MKKSLLIVVLFISFVFSDELTLKPGWNLVGIASEDAASVLSSTTEISKATGGGVGNKNSFVYLKDLNYSRGNFLLGQAYWIKLEGNENKIFEYTKVSSTPSQLVLKSGWNLVYPFKTLKASDLANYPQIEKATGGGVGNSNSFVYLKEINYSRGESLPNQGYWIKVSDSVDEVVLNFVDFDYRAWGVGGDSNNSKSSFRLNGIDYTMLVYSLVNISPSESSSSNNFTLMSGTVLNKNIPSIQINEDYLNKKVILKIFKSKSVFDDTTLVFKSDEILINSNSISFLNIVFKTKDDFIPISPSDDNIELPPKTLNF